MLPEERGPTAAKQYDTKPYASTNIIRHAEMHQHRPAADEPTPLPAAPINNKNLRRPVRYFGDTDLESQQSHNYSSPSGVRYVPRAKVMRSASTAAGMGAVRRFVPFFLF